MKNATVGNSIVAYLLVLAIFICSVKGDVCGGILESDAGEFDLPINNNYDGDLECIWVIQLLSRRTVSFTLNRLDSNSSTVSLYPEHEASETVLTPIRLSRLDIGQTTNTTGQTLVIVFTRSDYTSGLSFTWDSVSSATSDVLTAVNYVDSGEGRVLWNRFNRRERLTWALNLPSQNSLSLKAETQFSRCELVNPCWCSYFGVYEVTNTGYLREVTRVCGRSSTFETEQLYSKLVAFVYINSTASVAGSDHVELTWAVQQSVTEDPWYPSTSQPITEPLINYTTEGYRTTEDYSGVASLDCGGIIELRGRRDPLLVGYKHDAVYRNNERCLWTLYIVPNLYYTQTILDITLVSDELEQGYDEVHVVGINHQHYVGTSITSTKLGRQTPQRFDSHNVYVSFSSDETETRRGFVLKIEVKDASNPVVHRDAWSYSSLQGRVSYGDPYRWNDLVSIVVNPPNPGSTINFGVDFVDIEDRPNCEYDRLDIYRIGFKGRPDHLTKLCGQHDSLTEVFTTSDPILAYFSSSNSVSNFRGFTISWNETAGTGGTTTKYFMEEKNVNA